MTSVIKIDPKLDLVLEREIEVPVELVWKAWTTPSSLKQWFVPKPWSITSAEIDLRPGGVFADTLLPGYRPSPKPFFTAVLELTPNGGGTRYKAVAIHGSDETRKSHEAMGFHDGWGTVVTQMVEHIKSGK